MKYSKKYLDSITLGASYSELITWAYWSIFYKKKFNEMQSYLDKGMSFHFAMKKVK